MIVEKKNDFGVGVMTDSEYEKIHVCEARDDSHFWFFEHSEKRFEMMTFKSKTFCF